MTLNGEFEECGAQVSLVSPYFFEPTIRFSCVLRLTDPTTHLKQSGTKAGVGLFEIRGLDVNNPPTLRCVTLYRANTPSFDAW